MIVAVSSVKNEADIIRRTVTHLFGNGIDEVIISDGGSTDETWDVLCDLEGVCLEKQEGPFDQSDEMSRLAQKAWNVGADWVIPFDADEFWCATEATLSVAEVLNALPATVAAVHAPVLLHTSETHRVETMKLWGKVAFRPTDHSVLAWGNHSVDGIPGGAREHGILMVRELQYRDYAHLQAKVAKSRELFESWDVPSAHGGHMRALTAMSEVQLEQFWREFNEVPTIEDPIPYRGE